MWFNSNSRGPHFTAIEPDVNPLPSCLAKSRPDKYFKQFLPGQYSTSSINDPGFLTLPGELIIVNNYLMNIISIVKSFSDGTPAICEGYYGPFADKDYDDNYRHGRCMKFNMTEDTWTVYSTTPERRSLAVLMFFQHPLSHTTIFASTIAT